MGVRIVPRLDIHQARDRKVLRHQRVGAGVSRVAFPGLVSGLHRHRGDHRSGVAILEANGVCGCDHNHRCHAWRYGYAHLLGTSGAGDERNPASASGNTRCDWTAQVVLPASPGRDYSVTMSDATNTARLVELARDSTLPLHEQHAAFAPLDEQSYLLVYCVAVATLRDTEYAKDVSQVAYSTAWMLLRQPRDARALSASVRSIAAPPRYRR